MAEMVFFSSFVKCSWRIYNRIYSTAFGRLPHPRSDRTQNLIQNYSFACVTCSANVQSVFGDASMRLFVATGFGCERMSSSCPTNGHPQVSQPAGVVIIVAVHIPYDFTPQSTVVTRTKPPCTLHGSVVWVTRNFRLTFAIQTIKCKKRITYITVVLRLQCSMTLSLHTICPFHLRAEWHGQHCEL